MRKMLVLTVLALSVATMAGCRYCEGLRRGSLTQPWAAPTAPYCDSCTTCTPEEPCGVCESCASGSTITTTTTKSPIVLPAPGN